MEILKSTWAELTHGYSSPEAVRGRSLLMESRAQPAIEDIKRIRQNWLEKFQGDWPDYQDEVRKAIYGYEDEPGERIKGLQEEWQEINHGGQEEVEWTKQAVGLSTALFEKLKRERGNKDFCLRDNQVYYLMLLLLNKGNYLFGKLETQSRGVELPTGEGKTFGMGICAGIMAMRGEDVYVVEPNYISAKDHAGQMGEFIERFSSVQVGVVVDVSEKKGYAREIIVDQKGQIQEGDVRTGGRENYIYLNGELSSAKGSAWREKVLRKKIVYVDPNSLGFDKLEGVLPSLNNRVAIVAEADSVMLDSAFSPWIISEKTTGLPAMDLLSDMCDIEDLVPSEPNMNRTEQRLVTRAILFRLWHAFQTAEDDYFKEGEDFSASKEGVMFEPIAYEKARFLATMAIVGIVKQVNNSSIPDQEVVGLVDNWITNKYQLLEAALRASLGMKEGQEFLRSGKEIVLLDEFGFPLEKRQLEVFYHLFLQMKANWPDWWGEAEANTEKGSGHSAILWQLIGSNWQKIIVSQQSDRVLAPILFNQFKRLRMTSGSLLPAAGSFSEVYGADVLAVSRHEKIASELRRVDQKLEVKCLDGGLAQVEFFAQEEGEQGLLAAAVSRMKELKQAKRFGLFIVPDMEVAEKLKELMLAETDVKPSDLEVVTAKQELKRRGTLARAVGQAKPGKTLITTWMAHKDIDLKAESEIFEQGGPEVIVVGLLPTERALWQALQRTLRSDFPGTRRLMLCDNDLKLLIDREKYFGRDSVGTITRLEQLGERAAKGDVRAQKGLFDQFLNYLRFKEELRKNYLVSLFIRDEDLDVWREELRGSFMDNFYKRGGRPLKPYGDGLRVFRDEWLFFIHELEERYLGFLISYRGMKSGQRLAAKEEMKAVWQAQVNDFIGQKKEEYNKTYK